MKRFLSTVFLLMVTFLALGQEGMFRGKVLDIITGTPLQGAHIKLKDQGLMAVSDIEGNFQLPGVEYGDVYLEVSFVGYVNTEKHCKHIKSVEMIHMIYLRPDIFELDSAVIVATKNLATKKNIPASIHVINHADISAFPAFTSDQLFEQIPGLYINRNQGILSKSASVTMRGLSSSSRVLVLVDGVPINKADKGFINWNRIDPDNIERIEVLKGPASAVYGGNAMAGVIVINTKKADHGLEGEVGVEGGTFSTFGGHLRFGGNDIENNKGFYWNIYADYLDSDGYNPVSETEIDSTDTDLYLNQWQLISSMGYRFNAHHQLELKYEHFDNTIGDGKQVYEEAGGYNSSPTNLLAATYRGRYNQFNYYLSIYHQEEDYAQQKESVKSDGRYQLSNAYALRKDMGAMLHMQYYFNDDHSISAGMDVKDGRVDAALIYKTSTDLVKNSGRMQTTAFYLQDECDLFDDRIHLITGLRFDIAGFSDASFNIIEPSAQSNYMLPFVGETTDRKWQALSPRFAANIELTKRINMFASYAKGFRPAILDDMCRNGKISKGFKLANPELKPEYLDNYEYGVKWKHQRVYLFSSLFYSKGKDFHYFSGTGDSLSTGGNSLKPVLQRQNVGEVTVYGAEFELGWFVFEHLRLRTFYNRYFSKITEFITGEDGKDLYSKQLNEFPDYQFYFGLDYQSKRFWVHLDYKYTGAQWYDDENTTRVQAYDLFNLGFLYKISDYLELSLDMNDLLDTKYTDRKGLISPGRFIMLGINIKFNNTN